jgi:Tol biopolymer transport system component
LLSGRSRDFCALAAFAIAATGSPVARAQSIDQLTDFANTVSGPAALLDDGTLAYAGASVDPSGDNHVNRHQIFRFDTANGTAVRLTDFNYGVIPVSLDLTVTTVVGVSDDGLWIAFVSPSDPLGTNHDHSPELFVMDSNGGSLAQLTSDPLPNAGSVSRISFAGSGNRVAFVSTSDLTGQNPDRVKNVFTAERDGSGVSQLTDLPPGNFGGLSISDDGARIAFSFDGSADFDSDGSADNTDFSFEIFTVLSDGTGLTQMTDAVDFDSIAPFVSGDGEKIAFQSNANLAGQNNKNQEEVHVIDWDGSGLEQLTDSRTNISGQTVGAGVPSITDSAGDGTSHWVYYASNNTQSGVNLDGNVEVFKIRSSGLDEKFLTDTSFSDGNFVPVVSGDNTRVVFYSAEDPDGTADGRGNGDGSPDLFAMDPDGSNVMQLTAGEIGLNGEPDITPDGALIVFVSNADYLGLDPDRSGEIYKIAPDGTGLAQVTDIFTGEISEPTVCEDAAKIAFVSDADIDGTNADGSEELHFVNGDGTGQIRVTNAPLGKRVRNPVISRDCSIVFYDSNADPFGTNGDGGREVFSATTEDPPVITQITDQSRSEARTERPRIDDSVTWMVLQTDADLDGDGTVSGAIEVWRVRVDGSDFQRIGFASGFDFVDPDISGDGSLVAFATDADPLGTNPENNIELFLWDAATGISTQLTTTTKGEVRAPEFSNDGAWINFATTSDLFEDDPDLTIQNGRINVATLEIERIGGLQNGFAQASVTTQDGGLSVFSSTGSPTLENWDFGPEIFVVRHKDGPIVEIGVSGPAPTVLSVPRWVSGPMRYDFIRGDLSAVGSGGPEVTDLGAVLCLENDSLELDTVGDEDVVDPAPGQGFFYLWRGDTGLNFGQGSYGVSTDGAERTPLSGDCGV